MVRNQNVIALDKNISKTQCILKPNSTVTIKGVLDRKVLYPATCALGQPSSRSTLPTEIDINPSLVSCDFESSSCVEVLLSNITGQTYAIQPGAVLCELQPVTVEEVPDIGQQGLPEFMDKIDFTQSVVIGDELQAGIDLIKNYEDIFSHDDNDL